jgi:hypothetical protein
MFRKKFRVLIMLAALVFGSACSGMTQAPAVPIETLVAFMVASTLTAQVRPVNARTGTQAIQPTNTPAFTFTPSLIPTLTYTLTPNAPMVSVSVTTNCRTGPNTGYDLLGTLKVGEKAQVVGRSTLTDTMIIKLPSNPAITCWLWAKYATVSGDTSGLPVIPIPPSPTPRLTDTPQVSFDVLYIDTNFCDGFYRIKFKITNTGSLTWESDRVNVTDQTTSVTKKVVWDNFPYYSSECVESADQNLEAGEVGYTTSDGFADDPAGHAMSATLRVCSQNGMAGTCQEKTLTFTP